MWISPACPAPACHGKQGTEQAGNENYGRKTAALGVAH